MYDKLIKLDFWPSQEGSFYDVGSKTSITLPRQSYRPKMIGQVVLVLDSNSLEHERSRYNLLDLIGDLGGVLEVFIIFFGLIAFPISEFSFVMKAISILFLARTKDNGLFEKAKLVNKKNKHNYMEAKMPEELSVAHVREEMAIHRPIKLNSDSKFMLFMYIRFNSICCCLKDKRVKFQKLKRLYTQGEERLNQELNVE
jgi:hypothetical protein